jgi:hypothetical protein
VTPEVVEAAQLRSISSAEMPVAFRLDGGSMFETVAVVSVRLSTTRVFPLAAFFWMT